MQSSDLRIARAALLKPIHEVAAAIDIPEDAQVTYGNDKAKLTRKFLHSLSERPEGRLILVTAISPTPAGEGKTTTTIGLHDALWGLGKRSLACLREPSLGPCFGIKGGATGGGYAQVLPMESINLHFTGDFHAITSAHNLLSAMLDNHIHWDNTLRIDTRRIAWRRVLDINDRALRHTVVGLGGTAHGVPHESGFDITVSSELMAILCLACDSDDLRVRLSRIVVAYNVEGHPVTVADLKAVGAMMALLNDAFQPNLVQTLEHNPVLIHGGPFANIAHGCNSVVATRAALKLADYVVTEAGFGADLGAEKFFDIKCRQAGLKPAATVIVATVRALKMHGGVALADLAHADPAAVTRGCSNLSRHIANVRQFNVPVIVAINHFTSDTPEEIDAIRAAAAQHAVPVAVCTHWAEGGKGAQALAQAVCAEIEQASVAGDMAFAPLYPDSMPLIDKIRTVAQRLYSARDIDLSPLAAQKLEQLTHAGHGGKPVCIAKTQYSFSTDQNKRGAPSDHIVMVRDVRLAAGAGFVVVLCGEIMTMPGLPRRPAAEDINVDDAGQIEGLF